MEQGDSIGKWQKGRLLGSGSFGKVYKGIHRYCMQVCSKILYIYIFQCSYGQVLIHCYGSETGEFCAIKEVEFVRDDPKSKESAKQLAQVSKGTPSYPCPVFTVSLCLGSKTFLSCLYENFLLKRELAKVVASF